MTNLAEDRVLRITAGLLFELVEQVPGVELEIDVNGVVTFYTSSGEHTPIECAGQLAIEISEE